MNAKIKDKVKSILELVPSTRDNDSELISIFWEQELGPEMINLTAERFLTMFAHSNVLTNAEKIRRTRQKIQEQNEDLRGLKFKVRKVLAEEVRQTIKDL
jgi:hypothetical protein